LYAATSKTVGTPVIADISAARSVGQFRVTPILQPALDAVGLPDLHIARHRLIDEDVDDPLLTRTHVSRLHMAGILLSGLNIASDSSTSADIHINLSSRRNQALRVAFVHQ
jgi:hypothetical protein